MLHSNLSICIQDKYIAVNSISVHFVISYLFQTVKGIVAKVLRTSCGRLKKAWKLRRSLTWMLVECKELSVFKVGKLCIRIIERFRVIILT